MHSFLYFRRAGGPHISTLFYTCNMQKREKEAIFLRIFGEMAKKRRNMQPAANATGVCRASRPANTPARLAAWTASQNYVLLFSHPCRQYNHAKHPRQPASLLPVSSGNNLSSAAILFTEQISIFHQPTPSFRLARPTPSRPSSLQSKPQPSLSQHPPFRRQPASTPTPPIFPYQASQLFNSQYTTTAGRFNLPAANTLPSSLFSSFFLFSFLLSFFSYFSGIILNTGSSSTGSFGL